MAGYSGTPLAQKLGIGPDTRLAVLGAPDGFAIEALPPGVEPRASGMPTDITEDVVREVCLPTGLVDVKVCAVDEVWSALRLCLRKELRRGRTSAAG